MCKQTVKVRGGIEEAEMYARFAEETTRQLYQDPAERNIAAVVAFLEKSRAIMSRLITEELRHD